MTHFNIPPIASDGAWQRKWRHRLNAQYTASIFCHGCFQLEHAYNLWVCLHFIHSSNICGLPNMYERWHQFSRERIIFVIRMAPCPNAYGRNWWMMGQSWRQTTQMWTSQALINKYSQIRHLLRKSDAGITLDVMGGITAAPVPSAISERRL